jgi:hypothetical protein
MYGTSTNLDRGSRGPNSICLNAGETQHVTTRQRAFRQLAQAAKTRRIAYKIQSRAQVVRIELIQALLVKQCSDLQLRPVGKLVGQSETSRLHLHETRSYEMFPYRLESRGVKGGLVIPVADDLSLFVLVPLWIVTGLHVTALADVAMGRVVEAAGQVELGERLQCPGTRLCVSVI